MPETVVQYLVELEVYDPDAGGPGIGGVRTLRYATGLGHVTGPAETPANAFYDPIVRQALHIKRTMFDFRKTTGRATVATGTIDLANGDGALDGVADYGFDGRAVTIRRGAVGAAYPAGYPAEFVGTMEPPEFAPDVVRVKLRDRLLEMNVPLQTTKYSGAGLGTVEGTPDTLGGKPKPVCYGVVKNITPPVVESAKLIFQVADTQVANIDAVYDRGVALGSSFNWQLANIHFADPLVFSVQDIVYATHLQLYVAVLAEIGEGGVIDIYTSPDATSLSWTQQTTPFATPSNSAKMRYANGVLIITTGDGRTATSTDAITWTLRTTGLAVTNLSPAMYNTLTGIWCIVGGTSSSTSNDNGVTWTFHPNVVPPAGGLNAGVYGNGYFVLAGSNVWVTSVDGVTWNSGNFSNVPAGAVVDMEYSATLGIFLAVGTDGLVITSETGQAWFIRDAGFGSANVNACAIGGSLLIAAPVAGGAVAYSSDRGETWTLQPAIAWGTPISIKFGGGKWLLGGNGTTFFHSVVNSYASSADLLDDTLVPPPGTFKPYLSATGSYFRLGARPDGLITADVIQGATAADRTVAQIFKTILADRAGLSVGEWNATDITDLDALNNDVIGFWTDAEAQIAAALDLVAGSIGAAWYVDAAGVFRITQLLAPSGTPVHEFTANDIRGKLQLVTPNDPGGGIPTYQTIVRYARNYTAQPEVAPAVKQDRRAFVAKEWREATDTDATVQTKHLLARQWVENSLLADEADAQAEADRRQALRGVARKMFEFAAALDDDTKAIDINHVIKLTHERYGLSAGVLFRVLGVGRNAAAGEVSFTVWG